MRLIQILQVFLVQKWQIEPSWQVYQHLQDGVHVACVAQIGETDQWERQLLNLWGD